MFTRPAAAQYASIAGTVLIEPTGKPLPNAEVFLTAFNRSVRSDSLGNFMFTGLSAGKHEVMVRQIGYDTFRSVVTVGAGEKFEADFLLTPTTTTLANIEVRSAAPYAVKLAEFEERRKLGTGKYLTADVFEKEAGRPASSFLAEHIAGFKVVQYNGERMLASTRGGSAQIHTYGGAKRYPAACYMRVVLNGVIAYDGSNGQEMFDIDRWVNTSDIIGFEYYTVATTPSQYNRSAGTNCGTVIIWTK